MPQVASLLIDDRVEEITLPEGTLLLYRHAMAAQASDFLERLVRDVAWRQESITLFGKHHLQPRLSAWYGDPDASYRYSGLDNTPHPWTADLQTLRQSVQAICGHRFNSVLLNYYRNGNDAMGMHADDEPELGPQPVIASLSLGAPRRMRFIHRKRTHPPLNLVLEPGSLLIMSGATQRNWKHGINRSKRICGPRVNLTFRRILTTER
mgnify:CR=1 FL=1